MASGSVATRVEVVDDEGRLAFVDADGWHSADAAFAARLGEAAPLDAAAADPLVDAARRAAAALGVRILLLRRRQREPDWLTGAATHVYRALTQSALQRALGDHGRPLEDCVAPPPPPRGLRVAGLALIALGLGLAALAWAVG